MPEKLGEFLGEMQSHGYCGGNVTLPHKEKVYSACVFTTAMAQKIGAVNTLWLENGNICGDNTDVSGFLANLDAEAPGWDVDCGSAAVIGAGGAARAILVGLAERNIAEVKILNRSADRMLALVEEARKWGFRKVSGRLLDDKPAR